MACADIPMDLQAAEEKILDEDQQESLSRCYQPSEVSPISKQENLLLNSSCILGSLQIVNGLLSVGIGLLFAATQDMSKSLFTLFRLSLLTGTLFTSTGFLVNFLVKHPQLRRVCSLLNWACVMVAVVAASLISVDLAFWDQQNESHLKYEVLSLLVLGLEVLISLVLCIGM